VPYCDEAAAVTTLGGLLAAARAQPEVFPATLGERVFVGLCAAVPFAFVIAIVASFVVGVGGALVVAGIVVVALVLVIARFLAIAGRSAVAQANERRCRVCGTPFTAIRGNQVYCGPACREEAAIWRRARQRGRRASLGAGRGET
jgi:predicted nucleic acid-binding Zn ribbon protein